MCHFSVLALSLTVANEYRASPDGPPAKSSSPMNMNGKVVAESISPVDVIDFSHSVPIGSMIMNTNIPRYATNVADLEFAGRHEHSRPKEPRSTAVNTSMPYAR